MKGFTKYALCLMIVAMLAVVLGSQQAKAFTADQAQGLAFIRLYGLTWRPSHNEYDIAAHNCQQGQYCSVTITAINRSNFVGDSLEVDNGGGSAEIIANTCDQPIRARGSCYITIRDFLPSGSPQIYSTKEVSIFGHDTPYQTSFWVCFAEQGTQFCKD